jgi:hypothetical protein
MTKNKWEASETLESVGTGGGLPSAKKEEEVLNDSTCS